VDCYQSHQFNLLVTPPSQPRCQRPPCPPM
jgi:hypothetical protein